MKPLFTHAVVGLDQSHASDLIIDALPHLQSLGLKKVTLVTVLSISITGERTEINTDQFKDQLKEYKKRLEGSGLSVDTELRAGTYFYPPTEILTSADEKDADFVIVGSHGQSMVQEMLLGSTATEILQRSPLPVFLINMEVGLDDEDDSERNKEERTLRVQGSFEHCLDHVLHPTDFSETANRAFEVVKKLDAEGKVGKVSLIHVQGHHAIGLKDPASHDELTRRNREALEDLRNDLSDHTREDAEIIITFGTPGKEIIQTIEENGVTLAILGSQGRGMVEEFFIGGVSSQVSRFSNIPVLLVPAARTEA
jgi:nucleotide-binding universal stress UspA family protein